MRKIIEITGGEAGNPEYAMSAPINLCVLEGEQIAVVGDNVAGKSRLSGFLAGTLQLRGDALKYDFGADASPLVSRNVKYISFNDAYGAFDGGYYLQQRWNQQEIDEETPTAGMLLDRAAGAVGEACLCSGLRDRLYSVFGLEALLDKYIISLSSGELRKFHITKALLSLPKVLIIENPFIGLDAGTRLSISNLLGELSRTLSVTFILVMSRVDVMPDFITHVIPVEGLAVLGKTAVKDYLESRVTPPELSHSEEERIRTGIAALPEKKLAAFYPTGTAPEIVRLNGVSIRYGNRTILSSLDWSVREGERWAVCGENGCGKSTLFSLICADNPQSYACDIELFGHRRGSGESIWEIKKHIGYVSPEMHRAYRKNVSALDIVASGLFDTVGLFMTPDASQLEVCRNWMRIFGIEHLYDRPYLKMSSGEQRLCLLVRAFVKDPELLILDEPMHGLDLRHCALVKYVVNSFMERPHKTLLMVSHFDSELPSCIDRRLELKKNL